MYSKGDVKIIYQIVKAVSQLRAGGYKVGFNDEEERSITSREYKRYLKDFRRSVEVLGLNGGVNGDIVAIRDPRDMLQQAEWIADDAEAVRAYFGTRKFNLTKKWMFDNLDNPAFS